MRTSTLAAALLAATAFISASHATVVTDRAELNRVPSLTMVTFTEIKLDGKKTISDLGQPYKQLGLVLPDQAVNPAAAVPGAPGKAAAVSTTIDSGDHATAQTFVFIHPQRALGFNIRDRKATSIIVTAFDASGDAIETTTLKASANPQYIGFVRQNKDIVRVTIRAPHETAPDATSSPLEIADVTFTPPDLLGETTMLTPTGALRNEIDSAGSALFDSGHSGPGNAQSGAGNVLAYGGDPSEAVSSGGGGGGSSASITADANTHSNALRGVPSAPGLDFAPPIVSTDDAPEDQSPTVIADPSLTDPTLSDPSTEKQVAHTPLYSLVHLPEPTVASLLAFPVIALALRRRKPKAERRSE